jgi:hypothetical protein
VTEPTVFGWPLTDIRLLINIHRQRYGDVSPSEKRVCIYCGREKRITETRGSAFSLMSCADMGRGATGPRCTDTDDCNAYQRLSRRQHMAVDDKQARDTANAQPMRALSDEEIIDQLFTYHAPDQQQQQHLQAVRMAAKHLGHVILASVPPGADRSAAIRKLRESVMTANAAIVLRGGPNFY